MDLKRAVASKGFRAFTGFWRTRGYGEILEIRHDGYTLYEETAVSCMPVFEGPLEELAEHYTDLEVSPRGQAFSARRTMGITRIRFRRLKALPPHSGGPAPEKRLDPAVNFAVLWHTFAEHYAAFEVREVDWEAVYAEFQPRIRETMPAGELFDLFVDMLRPLRDGHVNLHSSRRHFNAGDTPPFYDRLATEMDRAGDRREVEPYVSELREWLRETIREDYLDARTKHAGNRLLEWGWLNESTGYLAIRAMAGFSGATGRPGADLAAADAAMARVVADFSGLPRAVIDLRGNGGGYDGVAMRLAGYFIDQKRLAFQKIARRGAGFTGKQPVYLWPSAPDRFTGDLIVLTSGLTASAAEVFVLALLQHPRLTLVGESTHGILSDALERHLPNGWFLTLSNELYSAWDGELYEDCGIPPHVVIPYLDKRGREAGRDPMLEYAMGLE